VSGIVDFGFAFVLLLGMMYWYGVPPSSRILAIPVLLLFAVLTALAVGLWSSALNARYRDVGQLTPFLIQCWMYASPVVYPVTLVPAKWRLLYSLNPMTGVIEGFRWALLGKEPPAAIAMAVSAVAVAVLLVSGMIFFRRIEASFADVV
jgi:lipopolysaccharide transport system permease protein